MGQRHETDSLNWYFQQKETSVISASVPETIRPIR